MKPTAARLEQKEMMQQKKHRMRMMTPGPPTAAYETCHTVPSQKIIPHDTTEHNICLTA